MHKNRIWILGTSGSGKTFLAKKLSDDLNIKHYDLDDIFWFRKYDKKRNERDRIKILSKICKTEKWIIEGVFSSWVDKAIKRSDLVIWLDIHPSIMIWRVISRFFKRRREHKESFKDLFVLIKYVISYRNKNQSAGYYKHKRLIEKHKVNFICIKNKKELNKFLRRISKIEFLN